MIDLFRILKLEYKEYVILFKCGSFYITFDSDATVLNNIFNYKIVDMKNNIKVGFPFKLIENCLMNLRDKSIYYLVIEDKKIIDKYHHGRNKYYKYVSSVFDIVSLNNRLDKIINKIKLISDNNKKDIIISEIEKLLECRQIM